MSALGQLSDVWLAPKATDNRWETARREGPIDGVIGRRSLPLRRRQQRVAAKF